MIHIDANPRTNILRHSGVFSSSIKVSHDGEGLGGALKRTRKKPTINVDYEDDHEIPVFSRCTGYLFPLMWVNQQVMLLIKQE